jgi:hypothetical protein
VISLESLTNRMVLWLFAGSLFKDLSEVIYIYIYIYIYSTSRIFLGFVFSLFFSVMFINMPHIL